MHTLYYRLLTKEGKNAPCLFMHDAKTTRRGTESVTAKGSVNGMRVGVVEDDALICGMLSETLERFGHVPTIYREGWAFLEELTGNYTTTKPDPFDIVLLDVLLPGSISGVEIINYLCITRPELPLIVMSAINSTDLANIQDQFPEVKILQKPFRLQALRDSIEEHSAIGA